MRKIVYEAHKAHLVMYLIAADISLDHQPLLRDELLAARQRWDRSRMGGPGPSYRDDHGAVDSCVELARRGDPTTRAGAPERLIQINAVARLPLKNGAWHLIGLPLFRSLALSQEVRP